MKVWLTLEKTILGDRVTLWFDKPQKVYDKFIIDPNDNSCTSQLTNGKTEITLITCYYQPGDVHASKRLVVKARTQ